MKALPELWRRLPVRIFLDHLNARETREMIAHRLRMAGGERPVFTDAGATKIHELAHGIPRAICALSDLAMVVAASRRLPTVDAPEVVEAHRDMERGAAADGFHYFHAARTTRAAEPRPADAP